MERAIDRPLLPLHPKGACDFSSLVGTHRKMHGQSLSIYCFGNLDLEQTLSTLPGLLRCEECKTIKLEKKISVFRLPLRVGKVIRSVYVKQHNVLTFWHRLASLVCASAALRSICGAAMLLKQGYATARPIAAVEYRERGILIKSVYLSEEISGAKSSANFWREDLLPSRGIEGYAKRRNMLRALGRLFTSLHRGKIYHNDLKASNILARDPGSANEVMFSLIDLQGVKKCFFLSERRKIKNLAQLNRTLGEQLTRTQKLFFLKAYLDNQFSNRTGKRYLVQRILGETRRQIIREKSRHPGPEKYSVAWSLQQ
jgi:tRNA A-37 threonylcarbamoyl transferase component Bud32